MSIEKFEDDCPGCRPAMIDYKTGKVLPDDDPVMIKVMGVWSQTTKAEREAFHRVCCNHSQEPVDMQLMSGIAFKMQEAMKCN